VRNLRRGHFPKITILFGEPLRWDRVGPGNAGRDDSRAVADEIFDRIKELYAVLEEGGRPAAKAWRP
jgi:1-acyl-sn-glycerol-3-phosphate acyltransferase